VALFGIVFNINPIAVNKVIMGNLGEEAVNPAAALRVIIGGSAIAIGITLFIVGIFRLNGRARYWSLWV